MAAIAGMAEPVAENLFSSLMVRVASAVVLAPPVLAAVYFGAPYFGLVVMVAAGIMAWEWGRMVTGTVNLSVYVLIGMSVLATGLGISGEYLVALAVVGSTIVTLIAFTHGRWMMAGAAYVIFPCLALIWLRADPQSGLVLVTWAFFVVWATDIGGYAFGLTIGGPKVAPRISPKKTWAGLIGAMICAAAVSVGFAVIGNGGSWVVAAALGAVMAVVSQAGDFFESGVKRRFGVKDSSAIIPGHGGLLDRVDGLLTVAVVLAVLKVFDMEGLPTWGP